MDLKREDVVRLAREAGLQRTHPGMAPEVLKFAELVAAAEREACAKVCDTVRKHLEPDSHWKKACEALESAGTAIRARGQS